MSEVMIPPWIIPEDESQEPLDEGSSVFGAAFAPGIAQRQSYGGMRLKLSRRHTVRLEEKAQLLSVLRNTRGRYNALRSKVHFALRGSFPATELLGNNTFANGATGWSGVNAGVTTVDRVLRYSATGGGTAFGFRSPAGYTIGVTQNVPYVFRSFIGGIGPGPVVSIFNYVEDSNLVNWQNSAAAASAGLISTVAVPTTGSIFVEQFAGSAAFIAGVYADCPYVSLSRCPLVDNGSNLLLRSDEFGDAAWTKTQCNASSNFLASPDGTNTGDALIEDSTAAVAHYARQSRAVSASALDYSFACALRAGTRTWAYLLMEEGSGGSDARAFFNLSSGVVGTASITGANWSNVRSFISPMGGGWYYCCVVARKINAATTINNRISLSTGNGVATYSGDGASYISAWRGTFAQSAVPSRLVQTTGASTDGSSQTGSALYVKGLPASTNGLLLPDDVFEISGELKTCTAALNSDAAGLGYLQFEPALFRSPADNDPVIILDPMGKFLMSNLKIENEFGTQAKVSYDLEHIYE